MTIYGKFIILMWGYEMFNTHIQMYFHDIKPNFVLSLYHRSVCQYSSCYHCLSLFLCTLIIFSDTSIVFLLRSWHLDQPWSALKDEDNVLKITNNVCELIVVKYLCLVCVHMCASMCVWVFMSFHLPEILSRVSETERESVNESFIYHHLVPVM